MSSTEWGCAAPLPSAGLLESVLLTATAGLGQGHSPVRPVGLAPCAPVCRAQGAVGRGSHFNTQPEPRPLDVRPCLRGPRAIALPVALVRVPRGGHLLVSVLSTAQGGLGPEVAPGPGGTRGPGPAHDPCPSALQPAEASGPEFSDAHMTWLNFVRRPDDGPSKKRCRGRDKKSVSAGSEPGQGRPWLLPGPHVLLPPPARPLWPPRAPRPPRAPWPPGCRSHAGGLASGVSGGAER